MSSYVGSEYGSSSSSVLQQENLGFRDVIYDVAGQYLEPDSQSSHQYESAPEEPNLVAQSFYDLLRLEDQELYPGCDFASPLNSTARLLNIKMSSNVPQQENLGFRDVIYDVACQYLDPGSQSSHQYESAPEEPNLIAQSFYDLLRLEDQELYPGYDFASPLNTTEIGRAHV